MGHVRPKMGIYGSWKGPTSSYVPLLDNLTNRHFAEHNVAFREACEKAGVKPTKDQARRWKQKKGAAYRAAHV